MSMSFRISFLIVLIPRTLGIFVATNPTKVKTEGAIPPAGDWLTVSDHALRYHLAAGLVHAEHVMVDPTDLRIEVGSDG